MLNKKKLIALIAEQTGYTRIEVRKILNVFIDTVFEGTKEGQKVRIGGLGVFSPVLQNARLVRNPQTMEECMFKSRYTLRFRAADDLIRKLNGEGGVNLENRTYEDD